MSSMIVRNDAALSVSFEPTAHEMKEAALAGAALIGRVSNPEEQAEAVDAQKALKALLVSVESSRKAVKEPVLEYGRRIDAAAKAFRQDLEDELARLMKLCGDYQTLEQAKLRAAESLRIAELNAIEREKQEAISKARNHEEIEAIQEQACEKAAAVPVVQPNRADGQVVSDELEVIVTDVHLLARCHPNCVKIEPRISEIKSLHKAGVNVQGVRIETKVKSSVRVTKGELLELER